MMHDDDEKTCMLYIMHAYFFFFFWKKGDFLFSFYYFCVFPFGGTFFLNFFKFFSLIRSRACLHTTVVSILERTSSSFEGCVALPPFPLFFFSGLGGTGGILGVDCRGVRCACACARMRVTVTVYIKKQDSRRPESNACPRYASGRLSVHGRVAGRGCCVLRVSVI